MFTVLYHRANKTKGFTLVEMIIVMAIMGILLTAAIPRLGMYRKDADDTVAIADAAAVYTALSTYFARHGADAYRTKYAEDKNAIVAPYLTRQPIWEGGELLPGQYMIEDVIIKDSSGNTIAVYPGEDQNILFSSAAEALNSITTNSFSQTNDPSLWEHHADRTGYNCPDVTMAGFSGGYAFEFVQGTMLSWNTAWENGTGNLIPAQPVFYKNTTNLKFITRSASGINGSFVIRASKDGESATRTINYSQGIMVDNYVPAMVFE